MRKLLIWILLILTTFVAISPNILGLNIPALVYHEIGDNRGTWSVTNTTFQEQMKFMDDNGYKTITVRDYMNWRAGKRNIPDKAFIIMIDDGKKNNLQFKPILDKYNFKPTIGIIVNRIGWTEYLTWQQAKDLAYEGWDIESHSMNHNVITSMTLSDKTYEYTQSQRTLQTNIGYKPQIFVYPFDNQNINERIICLKYYSWCSGATDYMPTIKYITQTTDKTKEGIKRITIINTTMIKDFEYMLSVIE